MQFSKEKVITAIDISDGVLRLAAVAPEKNNKALCAAETIKLTAEKEKDMARVLRLAIAKNRLTKSAFVVSFPRHLVTIRGVRFPTVKEEELRRMAGLQAVKYLPYSQDEIITAYKTIGRTGDGYTDILLVMAQKSAIHRYTEIFNAAGIFIETLALSCEGIHNWYLRLETRKSAPIGIVDFDRQRMHIQVAKGDILMFSRSIAMNHEQDFSAMNAVLGNIKLSLDAYSAERNEAVSRLILTGIEKHASDYAIFLSDSLGLPCEFISPTQNLIFRIADPGHTQRLDEASYTHLLGMACDPEKLEVNLLPRDIIQLRREKAYKMELTKCAVLLLIALTMGLGLMEKKIIEKRNHLKKIESQLKEMEPEIKNLTKLKVNAELVMGQLAMEGSSIDILREIYRMLPSDMSLTLFEFEDSNRILLRGTAKELGSVFNLMPQLEKSDYFKNVKINYATKRSYKQAEYADFEIVCDLRGANKEQ